MSVWTHVNVAIRFDGLPGIVPQAKPDLGKTCKWDDDGDAWDACTVPCGSEGSLQNSMVEYGGGLPWLAAQIWGDLRDYDDANEIVAYLNRICEGQQIRDGVGIIEVEYRDTAVYRYDRNKKAWTLTSLIAAEALAAEV